jgi:hypothetical protein
MTQAITTPAPYTIEWWTAFIGSIDAADCIPFAERLFDEKKTAMPVDDRRAVTWILREKKMQFGTA